MADCTGNPREEQQFRLSILIYGYCVQGSKSSQFSSDLTNTPEGLPSKLTSAFGITPSGEHSDVWRAQGIVSERLGRVQVPDSPRGTANETSRLALRGHTAIRMVSLADWWWQGDSFAQ